MESETSQVATRGIKARGSYVSEVTGSSGVGSKYGES